MASRAAIIAMLWAVFPVLGQQANSDSGDKGVVNQEAVRRALENALQALKFSPAGTPQPSPYLNPKLNLLRNPAKRVLPPAVCAISLVEAPADQDVDRGIVLKGQAPATDAKIVIPPPAPSCAEAAASK